MSQYPFIALVTFLLYSPISQIIWLGLCWTGLCCLLCSHLRCEKKMFAIFILNGLLASILASKALYDVQKLMTILLNEYSGYPKQFFSMLFCLSLTLPVFFLLGEKLTKKIVISLIALFLSGAFYLSYSKFFFTVSMQIIVGWIISAMMLGLILTSRKYFQAGLCLQKSVIKRAFIVTCILMLSALSFIYAQRDEWYSFTARQDIRYLSFMTRIINPVRNHVFSCRNELLLSISDNVRYIEVQYCKDSNIYFASKAMSLAIKGRDCFLCVDVNKWAYCDTAISFVGFYSPDFHAKRVAEVKEDILRFNRNGKGGEILFLKEMDVSSSLFEGLEDKLYMPIYEL